MFRKFILALGLIAVGGPTGVYANDIRKTAATLADCSSIDQGVEANPIRGGAVDDFVANHLKRSGPNNFVPDNVDPETLCLAERFEIQSNEVRTIYAGLNQRARALLYRIEISGARPRELTILYSAEFNLMSDTHNAFSVAENRGRHVDLYLIYDREPTYRQIRTLIEAIIVGTANPIMSAVWQDGESEPIITVSDVD